MKGEEIFNFKTLKRRLHKTTAAIWFNKTCRTKQLTPTYALTSYGFVPLLLQCRTPYAAVHTLVLLMMGITMPETCWYKSLITKHQISCILLVSLSSPYVHAARSQGPKICLMMGIMMPETCWDKSLIINIRLVASFWFLSLHPSFMMHGH